MFFRFCTLSLIFVLNVVYPLNLKDNHSLNPNLTCKEPKFCSKTPKISTQCAAFLNGPNIASFNPCPAHRAKLTLNLKEEPGNGEDSGVPSPESPRAERVALDSTTNCTIATAHSEGNEHGSPLNSDGGARFGVSELLEAAHRWEGAKLPNPQTELTPREIAEINDKFLRSLEESEPTFNQIVKDAIRERAAKQAKKAELDDSWRDVVEEFTIEVEGGKCYGCGATLQCRDESKRGFVAAEFFKAFNKSNPVRCKRCSSLTSGTFFSGHPSQSAYSDLVKGPSISHNRLPTLVGVDEEELDLGTPKLAFGLYRQHQGHSVVFSLPEEDQESLTRIKEASRETVNIVRNVLKLKKRKRITILYIIDAVDPHIELGLLKLIKSRQEQSEHFRKEAKLPDEGGQEPEPRRRRLLKREARADGGIKFYLVVNKIDLLPRHSADEVSQYFCKMVNSRVDIGLKSRNVFLVSCKLNRNINQLLGTILTEAKKLQNQVLFIGPTNSGKSTLINTIRNVLDARSHTRSRGHPTPERGQSLSHEPPGESETSSGPPIADLCQASPSYPTPHQSGVEPAEPGPVGRKVTSSIVPGTTLGVLGIRLGPGLKVYDTPGIFVPDSLISFLDPPQLKRVIANSVCSNKPMRVARGRSILLDKYVRIDVAGGRDFFVKCYLSNRLGVFVKRTSLLPAFLAKQFPNERLYYPSDPFTYDRFGANSGVAVPGTLTGSTSADLERGTSDDPTELTDEEEDGAGSYPVDRAKEGELGEHEGAREEAGTPGSPTSCHEFVRRRFEILLEGWHAATCDLCVKGLGFLTLGGALKLQLELFTRRGVQLSLRGPLLPRNVFPFTPRKS